MGTDAPDGLTFLTTERLIELNREVVGGADGGAVHNEGALAKAVEGPQMVFFGHELSWPEKVYVLMRAIGVSHPFEDGNKRTATRAVTEFYEENGVEAPDPDVIEDWINRAFDDPEGNEENIKEEINERPAPAGQPPYVPDAPGFEGEGDQDGDQGRGSGSESGGDSGSESRDESGIDSGGGEGE